MNADTFANYDVLEFYRSLPFNYRGSLKDDIDAVCKRTPKYLYPGLPEILAPYVSVIDVGCGPGWLSNSINFIYHSKVLGIDFNPVAIDRAREVAKALNLKTEFLVRDFFLYEPEIRYDVVISIGVLCVTNNCEAGLCRLYDKFVRPGGYVVIGLYHKYGRQPFLDHFIELKKRGATEEEIFARYRQLHRQIKDETHLMSWFRDQVLIPHETQHTLEEMLPIMRESGMELISTSINHFKPIKRVEALIKEEKKLGAISARALKKNRYFPGFFVFIAKRRQ